MLNLMKGVNSFEYQLTSLFVRESLERGGRTDRPAVNPSHNDLLLILLHKVLDYTAQNGTRRLAGVA